MTRSSTPTKEAIADYWRPRMVAVGITGESLEPDECWACGRKAHLDRAHIRSHAFGGGETVDNLVLLCGAHHHDSEHLSPEVFWTWLQNTRREEYQSASARAVETWRRAGVVERVAELAESVGEDHAARIGVGLVLQGYYGDLV